LLKRRKETLNRFFIIKKKQLKKKTNLPVMPLPLPKFPPLLEEEKKRSTVSLL
jgi:hypothetical protein